MFIDELEIILKAGHGGAGRVSFRPAMGGPDGGNGGRGGSIYAVVTPDITGLTRYHGKRQLAAEDGQSGGKNSSSGKNGEDLELVVPIGTTILDLETRKEVELTKLDDRILVCRGGLGGKGNEEFKSPTNTTPKYSQKGLPGGQKKVKLIVKLIADFGLIGLPNAGKSSLLNELTAADVKTANYPFTTLEPNLGAFEGRVLADIPGLIEGASQGKGLGINFLKHIEKVKLLIHCISCESSDAVGDYKIVSNELKLFDPKLLDKDEVIVLTKSDLIDAKELKQLVTKLKKFTKTVLPISIYDWESLEKFKQLLREATPS